MIRLDEGVVEVKGERDKVTAEFACFLASVVNDLPLLLLVAQGFYDVFCPSSPLTEEQKNMLFTSIKTAYETKDGIEDFSDACDITN